jgi:uncharacterized cofD-like protein
MQKEPCIVAIGGGTGLSTLLRGLKKYSTNLSAIVNVTDNGGSSGMLREQLDMPPPGDIRNCLLALADTESFMEKIFQYRFHSVTGLAGHNLGNLFLAAMTDTLGFEEAIAAARKVLEVKGQVFPVTLDKVNLVALFSDGVEVQGESQIPSQRGIIKRLRLDPPDSRIYPAAEQAIHEAEIILAGPGSLYTSILSNLLVPGLAEAIRKSKARKIYICNVMTQPGETDGYTAADHLQAIYRHVGYGLFDTVIVNTNLAAPVELLKKYEARGSFPVHSDFLQLKNLHVDVLSSDLLSRNELVRHDPDRLARLVLAGLNIPGKKKKAVSVTNTDKTVLLPCPKRSVRHDVWASGEK